MSSTESATWNVPGGYGGCDAHGTAPSSAQSTFTVPGSSWKERIERMVRAGRSGTATSPPYSLLAMTFASTARPAVTRSPSAVRTATARPPETSMPTTSAEQRISPPPARSRSARAWVSRPAPPCGAGKPTVWPNIDIKMPISPEPGALSGMSAWPALPAIRVRGDAPSNRDHPTSVAGVSSVFTKSRPPTDRSRASMPRPYLTGGNGVSRAPISWSPMRSHISHNRSQASPSPGCCCSIRSAVTARSRCSIPHCPSGKGCPSTAGACTQVRPKRSSPKDWMVPAAASG